MNYESVSLRNTKYELRNMNYESPGCNYELRKCVPKIFVTTIDRKEKACRDIFVFL